MTSLVRSIGQILKQTTPALNLTIITILSLSSSASAQFVEDEPQGTGTTGAALAAPAIFANVRQTNHSMPTGKQATEAPLPIVLHTKYAKPQRTTTYAHHVPTNLPNIVVAHTAPRIASIGNRAESNLAGVLKRPTAQPAAYATYQRGSDGACSGVLANQNVHATLVRH